MELTPHFVEKPWAGKFLSQLYPSAPEKNIGEAWIISKSEIPFLVKIIDTEENLSIQVHPNDAWAKKLENSRGKTECWLILNSAPGAGVYLGLKNGVTPEHFTEALLNDSEPNKLLNFYPVKRGDFIEVPAGTIHAIGGGITLLEIQQASGITYRLWDWGRKDRELHLEKGLKVCDFNAPYSIRREADRSPGLLMKHPDFECFLNEAYGPGWYIDLKSFKVTSSGQPTCPFVFVR